MKKCLKFLGVIALVVFALGVVCAGIGLLTGGNVTRIFSVMDENFHIVDGFDQFIERLREILDSLAVQF